MPNVRIAAAIAAGMAMSILLGWQPASAHAALVSTDPANGSTVAVLPDEVTATFSENIGTPAYVVVTAPNGKTVTVDEPTVVDRTVTATLNDAQIRGDYTMAFRVVSADGHPIKDSVTFTVEQGRTVKATTRPETQESFVQEHRNHLIWGVGAIVLAIGLLLWPARRNHD